MQMDLFSTAENALACVLWCDPCFGSSERFTIGLPAPLPLGLAPWLRQNCRVLQVKPLPSGAIAVQIWVPAPLQSTFRALPKPQGGSRHEMNYVQW